MVERVQESTRIRVEEAAALLGMSPNGIRIGMQRGFFDIGLCVPTRNGKGYRYYIYRDKVNKIIGASDEISAE